MASQSSFSSHGSASPVSVASAASAAASATATATASFSVFQEGPGAPLVFAPPLGTPELQALVDLFIALDLPASMKMDMIQRDFEAHTARTNERYKTYAVPSASTPAAPAPAALASPSTFTASPSSLFQGVFDPHFAPAASVSGGSGSGSGSLYLDASPVLRPSPTDSDLTLASDPLFPLSVPLFPTTNFAGFPADSPLDVGAGFASHLFPVTVDHSPVTAASMWPPTTLTASAPANPQPARRKQQRPPAPVAHTQRRRLSGGSSMQILTRTGEDVTHLSSRGTRTHEERENTRLIRQRGACPDCRRKKTRCNPDHAGFVAERVSARAGPYAAPAQSGRAKADAAAVQAAKASKAKAEGKKAVTTAAPVFAAPPQAPGSAVLAGMLDGGGGGAWLGALPPLDLGFVPNPDAFDWDVTADQGPLFPLFPSLDVEPSLATTLAMTTDASSSTADPTAAQATTSQPHAASSRTPPHRPPPPQRPVDARLPSRRTLISAPTTVTATAAATAAAEQAPVLERGVRAATGLAASSSASPPASETSSFSVADASMNGSCVRPGSAATGGLTLPVALNSTRPFSRSDATEPEPQLDGVGDFVRRGTAASRSGHSDERRQRERGWVQPTSSLLETLPTGTVEGESSAVPVRLETRHASTGAHTAPPPSSSATAPASGNPPILAVIARPPGSSAAVPRNASTQAPASMPSSSPPSMSPWATAALIAGCYEIMVSVIAAFLSRSAAVPARDDVVSGKGFQRERMHLGPALVACQ